MKPNFRGSKPREIILPKLHPAQFAIAQHPARFKVVSAGRRFGKGVLVIGEMFKRAMLGGKCRFISPSYASDSYQSAWNMAVNLANQIPGCEVHLQRKEFAFPTIRGAKWVQFRTAEEPDGLRGEGIDFAAFDEAAHVRGLEDTWQQCVRPSLMDNQGEAMFISTPKGFNFFNTLFNKGRDVEPGWASFQHPTGDNPNITSEEIAELRRSLPELIARQEIDAEFVQLSGAVFKRDNIRVIESAPNGIVWTRGWDLAFTEKTTSDYTAGAKCGMANDGTIIVADMVRGRMEWPDAVRCIAATAIQDGHGVTQGVEVVGAQVGALQTLLRDPSLAPYAFRPIEVHKDKLTRALPLVARSEQGKFAIVRGEWNSRFIDELCAFPECEHDDQCLTGNTLVLCSGLWKKISSIQAGEMVMTRAGLRRVLWAGQTGLSRVIKRGVLTGTPGHMVWTENAGWTKLQSLNRSHVLACVENPLFSLAGNSTDTRNPNTARWHDTFTRTRQTIVRLSRFTDMFGRISTAISRLGFASITSSDGTTIGFRRSNYAPRLGMEWSIGELQIQSQFTSEIGLMKTGRQKELVSLWPNARQGSLPHLKGERPKIWHGRLPIRQSETSEPALFAGKHSTSNPAETSRLATTRNAPNGIATGQKSGRLERQARYHVPVFNLKIEDCPEFFANGILVHNCDAVTGAFQLIAGGERMGAFVM